MTPIIRAAITTLAAAGSQGELAGKKLARLASAHDDLASERSSLHGRHMDMLAKRDRLLVDRENMISPRNGSKPVPAGDPVLRGLEDEIIEIKDRIAQLRFRGAQKGSKAASLATLIEAAAKAIRGLPRVEFYTGAPVAPKLEDGETLTQALDRIRAEIETLTAEAREVTAAPRSVDESVAIMSADVDRLLASAPSVDGIISGNSFEVLWPTEIQSVVTSATDMVSVPGQNAAAIGAFAIGPEVLKKKLATLIKARTPAEALDATAKAKRLQQINDAALALARQEEALSETLDKTSDELSFRRPDLSVFALLFLAAPKGA
jgi:hypothetical protein